MKKINKKNEKIPVCASSSLCSLWYSFALVSKEQNALFGFLSLYHVQT